MVKFLLDHYPEKFSKPAMVTSFKKLVVRHPVLTFRLVIGHWQLLRTVTHVKQHPSITGKGQLVAIAGFILNLANYELNKYKDKEKIVLWDELFLQRILSLVGYSMHKPPNVLLNKFIDSYERYSAIPVFLECEPGICLERIKKRGLPNRMKAIPSGEIKEILQTQKSILHYLEEHIGNKIVISTEGTMEELQIKINSQLHPLTGENL